MIDEFPSKLLEEAVGQIATLPGIGRKSALRMALDILRRTPEEVERFASAVLNLRRNIFYCTKCHGISDTELCEICSDKRRDQSVICVVETIRDVMCVEATQQFTGLYHVLGGVISPINGIGPGDIELSSLISRVENDKPSELIMALTANMDGDTTAYYIYRKLKDSGVKISTIARGISVGDELQYADEQTLGRSIIDRIPYKTKY